MPKPEIIGSARSTYTRVVHLVGDLFTYADINLLPILDRVRLAPEGADALAAASHLAAYYEAHAARPSFARTIPPAGPPRRAKSN
jgi:glutathione S-transferase